MRQEVQSQDATIRGSKLGAVVRNRLADQWAGMTSEAKAAFGEEANQQAMEDSAKLLQPPPSESSAASSAAPVVAADVAPGVAADVAPRKRKHGDGKKDDKEKTSKKQKHCRPNATSAARPPTPLKMDEDEDVDEDVGECESERGEDY